LNDQLDAGKMNVLSMTNYVNDLKDGPYKEFYPTGKVKMAGYYALGERTGEWFEYYNTGQVMTRVRYKRDVLHGWAYYYDKNGTQLSKTMWRDGFKLEGKDLEAFLKRCKDKNLDPNQ
jgi:antitoxin component YwqK of YwqJK toxin-antitoxin module